MKHASQLIELFVSESLRVKAQFFEGNKQTIAQTAETIAHALRNSRKLLIFGNEVVPRMLSISLPNWWAGLVPIDRHSQRYRFPRTPPS